MLKKYLILIVFMHMQFNLFSTQELQELVEKKTSNAVASLSAKDWSDCFSVGSAIKDFAVFLQEKLLPTKLQKAKQAIIADEIKALSTEAELRKCLVNNAFKPRSKDGFPINCNSIAEEFVKAHDMFYSIAVRDEFVSVTSEFDANGQLLPIGWSFNQKIATGVAILVATGTGVIALAPILFPGTEVAAQAQNVINKAQALSMKLSTSVQADMAQLVVKINTDKLAATVTGVKWARTVCKLGYQSPAEKLMLLQDAKAARPSLKAQIMQAYQAK